MLSIKNSNPTFSRLSADYISFVKDGLEKINYLPSKTVSSDLEDMNDELENVLVCQSKNGNKTAIDLLNKVRSAKKLLRKLHTIFNDPAPIFLDSETCFKAVRGELTKEELKAVGGNISFKEDYYNYRALRGVILRKLNEEIGDGYFNVWLTAMAKFFDTEKYVSLYNYFEYLTNRKDYPRAIILEAMAFLKDFDYKLNHKDFMLQHKKDKLKVIYLRHSHFNMTCDSTVYKAYFVDYKKKRVDIRFIDDALFEYDDNLMYCDIWSHHYDDGEYYDEEGEYYTDAPELFPEEKRLMSIFDDEHWVYQHDLKL